ncbi:SAM-dependent methyltransferase [Peribacillus sp. SCS-37]|uniref:SAM-dependent methyltransferase n=1 Tax=Paraperibacillus esterisolvens TaxID=3115296 RepID=UPI003905AA72
MKEYYYDKLLNIKTGGQHGNYDSPHYNRYEPTSYSALEELFKHYTLQPADRLVDFGCGKGRLNFYVHHFFHASVTGIEMDGKLYEDAQNNKQGYMKNKKNKADKIRFLNCLAEDYKIDSLDNRFYFFNPFSQQVFRSVVNAIMLSMEQAYREIDIILYYPPEDYCYYLDNQTPFERKAEIAIPGFEYNPNERFLIYCWRY